MKKDFEVSLILNMSGSFHTVKAKHYNFQFSLFKIFRINKNMMYQNSTYLHKPTNFTRILLDYIQDYKFA